MTGFQGWCFVWGLLARGDPSTVYKCTLSTHPSNWRSGELHSIWMVILYLTALFNNMRTLKLNGRPTNGFFAAVNQMFSGSSQLTTTAELCSLSELCTTIRLPRSAAVGSWEEPPDIWLTVVNNAIYRLSFEFHSPHVIERRSNTHLRWICVHFC